MDKPRAYSRQWDSPRGSLAGISSSGYGQSPAGYGQPGSGYGQASSGYGATPPPGYGASPRGSLTGGSGTVPRSRSPSAPHTSFRAPSHSPAAASRSFELGPSREGSRVFTGRNGPSPLLRDGTQSQLACEASAGRNTAAQKVSWMAGLSGCD